MSESTARAVEWLGQQLGELSGIRNATARDPSFKNWRQNTLTVMQRIWPADQARCERFRRIPFSPADPRADVRTQREWYSRGCQEAARVLASFVDEIRAQGVPDSAADLADPETAVEFEDDFPTVDLPGSEDDPDAAPHAEAESFTGPSPRHAEPPFPSPPEPRLEAPSSPAGSFAPAEEPEQPGSPSRSPEQQPGGRAKKGLGVAAKLRDLLVSPGSRPRRSRARCSSHSIRRRRHHNRQALPPRIWGSSPSATK